MKASEVIDKLQTAVNIFGDWEVEDGEGFAIEHVTILNESELIVLE